MNDLWAYSPKTLRWREIKAAGDVPARRSNCTMSYDPEQGQLVVFGGGGSNKQRFNAISVLEWESQYWWQVAARDDEPAPWERTYHVAEFKFPYLILFGGQFVSDLADLWIYNFRELSWAEVKFPAGEVMPRARRFHSSALVGHKFYIFGGCYDKYSVLGDLHVLDLASLYQQQKMENLHWRQIPLKGEELARWGHSFNYYRSEFYVFGGRSKTDQNDLVVVDPESGETRRIEVKEMGLPQARRRHAGTFVGSSLVIFGGFDGSYFDDMHYINLMETVKKQSHVLSEGREVMAVAGQFENMRIETKEGGSLGVAEGLLAKYFQSRRDMRCFLETINGEYQFQNLSKLIGDLYMGNQKLLLKEQHLRSFNTLRCRKIEYLIEDAEKKQVGQGECVYFLEDKEVEHYLEDLEGSWYCDGTIANNQTKVPINRAQLSSHSNFFSYLLSHHYISQFEIYLNLNAQPLIFRLVIAYLHTGKLMLPKKPSELLLGALLRLAEYFTLTRLSGLCEGLLCGMVWTSNWQSLEKISEELQLHRLREKCVVMALKAGEGNALGSGGRQLLGELQWQLAHCGQTGKEKARLPISAAGSSKI